MESLVWIPGILNNVLASNMRNKADKYIKKENMNIFRRILEGFDTQDIWYRQDMYFYV